MNIFEEKDRAHRRRFSGILLHPTSLPGDFGIGDMGQSAREFVDFLDAAGQSLWQMLPLGPVGAGNSPYQPYSAFAGEPLLISPRILMEEGLLREEDLRGISRKDGGTYVTGEFNRYSVEYDEVREYKTALFHRAYDNFTASGGREDEDYKSFLEKEKSWLDDYAAFMTMKEQGGVQEGYFKSASERDSFISEHEYQVGYHRFIQYKFLRQWISLKEYADSKGVYIVGDIPIFVSPDSADVWADSSLFQIKEDGSLKDVAGVPPDYFSATGQLWGNPLYDWKRHKKDGYSWWISRIKKQLELVDVLRIDHFRGFESYWAVPAGSETAMNGRWQKGPGYSLFKALKKELGDDLPIIAEDLGTITPEVEELRDRCGFPGMKILQFAFEGDGESTYLPYLYDENCVCYTGTHDNNTCLGWYMSTEEKNRDKARKYMMCSGERIHWDFIRTALSSIARYAVFPMQDLLGYGEDCRMNIPGQAMGNWTWRLTEEAMSDGLASELRELCRIYGRSKDRL